MTLIIMVSKTIINVLLFEFLFVLLTNCSCPEGFRPFEEKACFFYKGFNVNTISREEAKLSCQSKFSSTLATIDNPDQELWLVNEYMTRELAPTKDQTAWIGLMRAAYKDSQWIWEDASIVQYRNWGPNEPNNFRNVEDCVLIVVHYENNTRKYAWNDAVCNQNSSVTTYSRASGYFCRLPFYNHIDDGVNVPVDKKYSNLARANIALSITVIILLLLVLSFVGYTLWANRELILLKWPKVRWTRTISTEELKTEQDGDGSSPFH